MENYVFLNKDNLVNYLISKLDNPTQLKIQKGMYFLWAFYSATYGNIDYKDKNSEFYQQEVPYPKELFDGNFEAWRYGPVLPDVYENFKNNKYKSKVILDGLTNNDNNDEIILFINDIISQINNIDDFGLVIRSQNDLAWKDKVKNHDTMNKIDIKNDYIKYVNQG